MTGHWYFDETTPLIDPKTMYLISNVKDIAEWVRAEFWSQQDLGGIFAPLSLTESYLSVNQGMGIKWHRVRKALSAIPGGYQGLVNGSSSCY